MGVLSARMADHLYWLGRYLERIEAMAQEYVRCFDYVIDRNFYEGKEFFQRVGIEIEYQNSKDFLQKACYGDHGSSLENLIIQARENAIVCRDLISDKIFSSINRAYNTIREHKNGEITPFVIDQILKDIDRVWGAFFDRLVKSKAHYFIEFGQSIEIADLKIRIYDDFESVEYDCEMINSIGKMIGAAQCHVDRGGADKNKALYQINSIINSIIKYD